MKIKYLTKYFSLYFKPILLALIVYCSSANLSAKVILHDHLDQYHISDSVENYTDVSNTLSIEDITAPEFNGRFIPGRIPYMEENYNKTYWIRFTVTNNRKVENQSWYFESWGFDIDHVEFYVPNKSGGYFKTRMGYAEKFSERNIYHKNLQFLIKLDQGESATYYIRLQRQYPMHLTFFVRTHEAFIKHMVYEYWYLGIFYGIFAFIILLNLYLFFSLKESVHLYYVLLAASEVLYCLGRDGLGFQFLWPSHPWFNNFTHHNYLQFFFIAFTLLYSLKFLKLRQEFKFMYKLTIAAVILKAAMFIFFIFYPIKPFYIFAIDSVILIIPFTSGILSAKKGNRYARFYLAAFSFLFISFLLIFAEEGRLLPYILINWYFINIGMLLEVIFLAIALMDQIKWLRKENEDAHKTIISELREKQRLKDRINEELEYTISARTKEIQSMMISLEFKNQELLNANQELQILSDKVKQMNELLNKDNEQLKTNITEIHQSRILLKDVKFEEFQKAFPDDKSCLKFIADLKWRNGFECKKCGYKKGILQESNFGIRCRNCKYIESPTSGTLFHKLKFPVTKAFYLMYLIQTKGNSMTIDQLSDAIDLRRETCWSFRNKILNAKNQFERKGNSSEEDGWASLILHPLQTENSD